MSHRVSYKWIIRTQYITSIGLFYNNMGILLGVPLTLWRISGGYLQVMMRLTLWWVLVF